MAKLYDVAKELLAACANHMAAEGSPPPSRRYVQWGEVAFDFGDAGCAEQLVVEIVREFPGPPLNEAATDANCSSPRSGEYRVWVIRCVEVLDDSGNAPSAQALDDDAAALADDALAMRRAIIVALRAGEITSVGCEDLSFGVAEAVGPDGGVSAVRLSVQAGIF